MITCTLFEASLQLSNVLFGIVTTFIPQISHIGNLLYGLSAKGLVSIEDLTDVMMATPVQA